MRLLKRVLFAVLPFAVYTVFNSLMSPFFMDDPQFAKLVSLVSLIILASIMGIQWLMKDRLYFPTAIFVAMAGVTVLLYLIPEVEYRRIVSENVMINIILSRPQFVLYGSLFLMASVPQLTGVKPFTVYFAAHGVPEPFRETALFKKVNNYISSYWAVLFALCFTAQFIPQLEFQIAVPLVVQLLIGLPGTIFLKKYLIPKFGSAGGEESNDFLKTAYDAVAGMPYVFNKKAAEGLNLVYQFIISGDEEFEGYIGIESGECVYNDGRHPSPTLTMKSSAEVWLKIAKNQIPGQDAFLKGLFTMEGDLGSSLLLDSIFKSGNQKTELKKDKNNGKSKGLDDISFKKKYYKMNPGSIKKVVAIVGSPRDTKTSKTDIITQAFLKGCCNAGAEVETVYLAQKNINHCIGCYTCWTKTPGVCVFKDDVADIMMKAENADLVVYASPLYHFGIISILKKYIERTLPKIKPYLVERGDGETTHPAREGYNEDTFAVIIGVCGFPEVSHFGAYSANFHYIANAGGEHGINIVAELYRPYSEVLGNPFYQVESKRVLEATIKAGEQVVKEGFIDQKLSEEIGRVNLDRNAERETANTNWDICIEKKITMSQLQQSLINGETF